MTEFLHGVVFVLSLVFLLALGLHGMGCEVIDQDHAHITLD
jgi:hypothetical protein